jgi:hypothetical protein
MTKKWSEPLTQEECDQLGADVRVLVVWSGGNGPHEYVTGNPRHGHAYIPGGSCDDGDLTFVGKASSYTIVRRMTEHALAVGVRQVAYPR